MAYLVRTPAAATYLRYAEWSLLVARDGFVEALDAVDAVHDTMRRSRRLVAGVTRAGLRTQAFVELVVPHQALAALYDLGGDEAPAASAPWWRAWALWPGAGDRWRSLLTCGRSTGRWPTPGSGRRCWWWRSTRRPVIGDVEFTALARRRRPPAPPGPRGGGRFRWPRAGVSIVAGRRPVDLVLGDPRAARRSLGRAGTVIARRTAPAAVARAGRRRCRRRRRGVTSPLLQLHLQSRPVDHRPHGNPHHLPFTSSSIHAKSRTPSPLRRGRRSRRRGQRLAGVARRRWAAGFVDELLEHHHAEDEHLFPDLRTRGSRRRRQCSTGSKATTASSEELLR